jgi:proliferating cell nuclear antigen
MKIQISDKKQKDIFISLFQLLKNCSSHVNISFYNENIHIQGMDKSHICLYDVKIDNKWFTSYYIKEKTQLCFDSSVFHSIISTKSENQDLVIQMEDNNSDILCIQFLPQNKTSKGDFKKSFKIPLIEYEYEEMNIPVVDYDAEFSLSSKQMNDVLSELSNFGTDILIKCTETEINLTTNGVTGEMNVEIPIEDLNIYSIVEGEEIKLTYSLSYIYKMCISNKLSTAVDFSLSNDCPMKINYHLGDNSSLVFFIAPKMND